ncbi:MAG TPA: sulfate ABC transporter substrate-binding protein [Polyangia bacterium]|nr:sulfate ABC transporter substrate-binding protein [Polyangia bacterium]
MRGLARGLFASVVLLSASACGVGCRAAKAEDTGDTLIVGAYSAPREAFEEAVIPAFRAAWRRQTGRDIVVRASYLGSGAQARAIAQGFEADVAVLALDSDVDKLVKAALVAPDWRARTGGAGLMARSLVVIAVRSGNPKGIADWADLGRPGVEVLTPNPRTSGGAMWNLLAVYGSAAGDVKAKSAAVARVLDNVIVMDKAARESLVSFERGIGDAAITYEQEVHVARRAGRHYDYVVPPATAVIDVPMATVDRYADAHGRRAVAEAFVAFLRSRQGQALLGGFGFRPATGPIDLPGDARFPAAGHPFTAADFGGWKKIAPGLFAPDTGAITRVLDATREDREALR